MSNHFLLCNKDIVVLLDLDIDIYSWALGLEGMVLNYTKSYRELQKTENMILYFFKIQWVFCLLLFEKYIDWCVRTVNVFCKVNSEVPVLSSFW